MKYYIARDEDNRLFLYHIEGRRAKQSWWDADN